jgi:hypothetical protein
MNRVILVIVGLITSKLTNEVLYRLFNDEQSGVSNTKALLPTIGGSFVLMYFLYKAFSGKKSSLLNRSTSEKTKSGWLLKENANYMIGFVVILVCAALFIITLGVKPELFASDPSAPAIGASPNIPAAARIIDSKDNVEPVTQAADKPPESKEQTSNDSDKQGDLGLVTGEVLVTGSSGADNNVGSTQSNSQAQNASAAVETSASSINKKTIYSVQGPDGRIYDLEGPEGASDAQVIGFLKRHLASELAKSHPSTPVVAATTANGLDSLVSKARGAIGALTGNSVAGRFKTTQDCFDFVRTRAGTSEKMRVGAMACQLAFQDGSDSGKKNSDLGACILNNYADISDDASGTRVVSRCGESTANPLSAIVAREFSPSARMEKLLEENREKMKQDNEMLQRRRSGPFIMMIDGRTKTCIRIGEMLDCN